MRLLEIILVSFIPLRLLLRCGNLNRWQDWLTLFIVAIAVLQLALEGYRWQLIPAYVAALVLGLVTVYPILLGKTRETGGKGHLSLRIIGSLIVFLAVLLPPLLLPVPRIYQPTGPFPVGTRSLMLVDFKRTEHYGDIPNQPRRLMVQLWYPTSPDPEGSYGPWVEDSDLIAPAISRFLGFPSFFLDHLRYANGNAYPDTPLMETDQPFPILVFSHGWSGFRAQNTFQMVALASHGYVVAAPDHTYGAIATVFPDGQVAYNHPMALPTGKGLPEEEFLAAARLLGSQWSHDLSFILDTLQSEDPTSELSMFQDRLNFDRVGALGHSTGGGAALQFCVLDSRCQAALGMDPYMDPVAAETLVAGVQSPLMAMFSELRSFRSGDNLKQFEQLSRNSSGPVYHFEITGTAHFDFTDLPAFSPLASTLGLKGPIDGDRALQIVTDFTLAFFGEHLQGMESEILQRDRNAYPEVIWR